MREMPREAVAAMRILVTGSRTWTDRTTIYRALVEWMATDETGHPLHDQMILIHGGAIGADRIAGNFANAMGWGVEIHPAEWGTYGKRAGILRNVKMVDLGADIVLAFIRDYSPGATHCATYAGACGLPVKIWR